jgi:hypothetical protein
MARKKNEREEVAVWGATPAAITPKVESENRKNVRTKTAART